VSALNAPHFQDSEKAREYLESLRWPDGPVCPHCGSTEGAYRLKGKGGAKGTSARAGALKCKACRRQYSVTVGTVFERSHIPLHVWLQATYLICSSKKGMSAHQLHRTLGVTYKTAWFMSHRIREAMREGGIDPMGGNGAPVEIDTTFIGGKPRYRGGRVRPLNQWGKPKKGRRPSSDPTAKAEVLVLVERGGRAHALPIKSLTTKRVREILSKHVSPAAHLMTDEASPLVRLGRHYQHDSVNHSAGEYARGNVSINTAESYFALLKRGVMGTFHHISKRHLHRYCDEFSFRWSYRKVEDAERAEAALRGIEGKRLTYRQPKTGGIASSS